MKLAFSTNAFTKHSLNDALTAIARIGYQGAEIMADRPHLWPPDIQIARAEEIVAKAADLGLTLCNINGFTMKVEGDMHHPSWIEPEETGRRMRAQHTVACLGLAHAMKIPFVSTEPGGPVQGNVEARGREYALFSQVLAGVLPRAEELGVTILIEPEPNLLFDEMESAAAFLDNMDSDALGVNFDAGHFFCVGDDPAALIKVYKSFIKHIHIEDIAANREHKHLIPGTGAMDFGAFFDALKEWDYKGFVTVELYPYDSEPEKAAEQAFDFLRPFFEGTL